MAYEWCSTICGNHQNPEDRESLLFLCLEIGFRHLDFRHLYIKARLTHTDYHRELADIVFKSRESEAIADLLYAWTVTDSSLGRARALLGTCTGHLVNLHNLISISSRLRGLVIRSVELIGYEGFEGVGVERLVESLNHLRVSLDDMDDRFKWAKLLLDTLESSEGARRLSYGYWELLVELAISKSLWLGRKIAYSPQIVTSLTEAREWSKLEYWMGTVWMAWPPGADGITEEDLGRSMPLLFHQRPGAVQKLEQWMKRWSQENGEEIPEPFRRICRQAREAAEQDEP